ncbi:MAG: tripartite tricarboxylate transporter TctB family protein [Kiloniellales bacterium]|nr:tripartite tricarboxylate transporter TctB family protein [Kiloniellales bacterium]
MGRLNRDAVIAILLLAACGVLFWSTFSIRDPDYGQLPPSAWPRVILAALTLLSAIYLFQSLSRGPAPKDDYHSDDHSAMPTDPIGWLAYWRNPIYCFVLFFLYLVTLPVLGSLIGGVLFVFTLMSVLGGWQPRKLALHAVVALATVGGMWSLFTFALEVILPPGVIFSPF